MYGEFLLRAISKERFSNKDSEPGFPGSEKLWNRNFPERGIKKYCEIGRSIPRHICLFSLSNRERETLLFFFFFRRQKMAWFLNGCPN